MSLKNKFKWLFMDEVEYIHRNKYNAEIVKSYRIETPASLLIGII